MGRPCVEFASRQGFNVLTYNLLAWKQGSYVKTFSKHCVLHQSLQNLFCIRSGLLFAFFGVLNRSNLQAVLESSYGEEQADENGERSSNNAAIAMQIVKMVHARLRVKHEL
jgi:hypothetical protein